MSFCSIDIFLILNLLGKMPSKFEFIGEVHNKIPTNKIKRTLTRCKTNNNIQNKQKHWKGAKQNKKIKKKLILKWNWIYDKL
jgi:hypothetical protein